MKITNKTEIIKKYKKITGHTLYEDGWQAVKQEILNNFWICPDEAMQAYKTKKGIIVYHSYEIRAYEAKNKQTQRIQARIKLSFEDLKELINILD